MSGDIWAAEQEFKGKIRGGHSRHGRSRSKGLEAKQVRVMLRELWGSPGRLEPWLFLQGLLGLFPSHLGFSPGTEQNLTCQVCSSQDFTVKKFKFSTPTVLQARL